MKPLYAVVLLAAVAACSAPSTSGLNPGTPANASSDPLASAVPSSRVKIRSIGIAGTINGSKQSLFFSLNCFATDVAGIAKGCLFKAPVAAKLKINSGLFTQPSASGCEAATGTYRGSVGAKQVIPIVFKWTGKC